jgi:hypothetical protein
MPAAGSGVTVYVESRIQNPEETSALCGAAGQEGEILRKTIPLGIAACLLLGLFLLFL